MHILLPAVSLSLDTLISSYVSVLSISSQSIISTLLILSDVALTTLFTIQRLTPFGFLYTYHRTIVQLAAISRLSSVI